MEQLADSLSEKIHTLSTVQRAEGESFIDFLQAWDYDRELTRDWARASEPAFDSVWRNPEDAVYDDL